MLQFLDGAAARKKPDNLSVALHRFPQSGEQIYGKHALADLEVKVLVLIDGQQVLSVLQVMFAR